MLSTNFNIRDKNAEITAIYLVLRWNKNRIAYPINDRVKVKDWYTDSKSKKYNTPKQSAGQELIARLKDYDSRSLKIFRTYTNDHNKDPDKQKFKYLLDIEFNRIKEPDLFDHYGEWIKQCSLNGTHQPKTTGKHELSMSKLKEFDFHCTFSKMDLLHYDKYMMYLDESGLKRNTIGKHADSLKAFLRWSIARGLYHNQLALLNMKSPHEETEVFYLKLEQVKELIELDLSSEPTLDRARDLFILSCFTALRLSDLKRILPENIKDGYLEIKEQKTKGIVHIPIHKVVRDLMVKYSDRPNKLPPSYTDQHYNRTIKKVCDLVPSIDRDKVTSHTGRRTFINLAREHSWFESDTQIRSITGHLTETAFYDYIGSKPKMNIEVLTKKMDDSWKT